MCQGNTHEENIGHLKKSIAKMMVYWVVYSRHDLREQLQAGNFNDKWDKLALQGAFNNMKEYKNFLTKASKLYNEKVVKDGAVRVDKRVHGMDGSPADWCPVLDQDCPSDPILNAMFEAAMKFVDDNFRLNAL